MATLYGQNFRVLWHDPMVDENQQEYEVIAGAKSCVITYNSNTEDGRTKDTVGMAGVPIVTTQSWQVQVDTLNVSNMATLLTAIKNGEKFELVWDEVSTTDNQTMEKSAFGRVGDAYISDFTVNFNDRESSVESIQFTGSGAVSAINTEQSLQIYPLGGITKGQFVRLFVGEGTVATVKPIAFAKNLSFHVSLALEQSHTKDTAGYYEVQEQVGLSYDISSNSLIRSGETITSQVVANSLADIERMYSARNTVYFQIANVSGANNRTKGAIIVSGAAVITSLRMNGPEPGQKATYDFSMQGVGDYTVGS